MLKNKKNIRILLPIVIAIYGVLFYRIFDTLNPDPTPTELEEIKSFTPAKIAPKEQFTLLPVESDPFLGTLYTKKNTKKSNGNSTAQAQAPWPSIEYLGLVAKNSSSAKVFILNVDGVQLPVSKGELIQGIKVVGGNEQSVRLRFEGVTKEIPIR